MKNYYLILILFSAAVNSFSQPPLAFVSFQTGLTAPVDIVNAKDGSNRLFIVQQNGIVRIRTGGTGGSLLPTPFLNIYRSITYDAGGERGLLSIVFHPQYSTNGYFFVFYNNATGDIELAQYHVSADANIADPTSGKVMLTIPKPFSNHNGCKLNFGPDGNLYFAPGDGGSGGDPGNRAQDLNSLLGKMLRINVDNFLVAPYYTIPPTNPFIGIANTRPEIYNSGLRNPWRWNFDRLNYDMWIADVGQGAWEEVNRISFSAASGLNYGWRCYEGMHSYDLSQCGPTPLNGKTFPVFEYPHNSSGGFSITGGLVYRGTEFPSLYGWYICADFVRPNGWLIKPDGAGGYAVGTQNDFPAGVSTFGDAEDGTLYLATLAGTIFKVNVAGVVAVNLISFNASYQNGNDLLNWRVTPDAELQRFEIERSDDGTRFNTIGTVLSVANQSDYFFTKEALSTERYYRIKIISNNRSQYSPVKKLSAKQQQVTVVNNGPGALQLINTISSQNVFFINVAGQRVKTIGTLTAGSHPLPVSDMAKGIYFLQCETMLKQRKIFKVMLY